jgi:tetratricopeptide (TPR) repeat protein
MKMIKAAITALIVAAFICGCAGKNPSQSPEAIFNSANSSMSQGDYVRAIELFYSLYERHPDFKTYRCDVVFRLGYLLYKAERYDESEKILTDYITKYASCKPVENMKKAYIILISIYIQELHDDAKADRLRAEYVRLFGRDSFINNIDRTLMILNLGVTESQVLKLEVKDITIKSFKKAQKIDREFYPVVNYVKKSALSPNKRYEVKRSGNKNTGYYLYLTDLASKKTRKLSGTRNGYGPQWSWDGRYIVYNAMDWDNEERKIKVYDLKRNTSMLLFNGKNVGDVISISPDASKIVFAYYGRLWIMNRINQNMALLSNTVDADNIVLMAWSRDGDSILLRKKWAAKKYTICQLGRVEIKIIR